MMTDPHRVQSLAAALGSALDAAIAERPGTTTMEVCSVLGAIAGVTVAQSLPSASHEDDEAYLNAVTGAYRSTLVELLRQAWDARRPGVH